jgi:hypothetical protein
MKINSKRIFDSLPYASSKHTSYFDTYDRVLSNLSTLNRKQCTVVEVGVQNGGSLCFWREVLGSGARIIGVDLNPEAKLLETAGFEIYIGSQSDPNFWKEFYLSVGEVDILVDDGGHTDLQQIVTLCSSLEHIKDGGCIITEDCHTSYMSNFGNPSDVSFMSFSKRIIDSIMSRSGMLPFNVAKNFSSTIWAVEFYESIVVFNVDRTKCFKSEAVVSPGQSLTSEDYRYVDASLESKVPKLIGYFSQFSDLK